MTKKNTPNFNGSHYGKNIKPFWMCYIHIQQYLYKKKLMKIMKTF